jgi:hypothetical protein
MRFSRQAREARKAPAPLLSHFIHVLTLRPLRSLRDYPSPDPELLTAETRRSRSSERSFLIKNSFLRVLRASVVKIFLIPAKLSAVAPSREITLLQIRNGLPPLALTARHPLLYIVRMKQVTASEARKNWFRLLDEALDGEVIAVQRKGHRLVLRREDVGKSRDTKASRQYKRLLRVPDDEKADKWSWDWRGSEHGLVLRRRSKR